MGCPAVVPCMAGAARGAVPPASLVASGSCEREMPSPESSGGEPPRRLRGNPPDSNPDVSMGSRSLAGPSPGGACAERKDQLVETVSHVLLGAAPASRIPLAKGSGAAAGRAGAEVDGAGSGPDCPVRAGRR